MLIGEGKIGVEPFGWLLRDRRSQRHPAHPRDAAAATTTIADDDPSADPYDVRMMELLRAML